VADGECPRGPFIERQGQTLVPEPDTYLLLVGALERWPSDTTQYVFSAEGGVFYLGDAAGGLLNARLRSLGIEEGGEITITRTKVPNPHTSRVVAEFIPGR
jgi:hypothetical protein